MVTFQYTNVFAQATQTKLLLANCAIGAEEYASYSYTIDKYYVNLINEGRRDKKSQEIGEAVKKYHSERMEEESAKNYKIMQKQIEKGWDPVIAETLRLMMEVSINIAFLEAVESMRSGTLGRSKDFYERKIYDSCVKDKKY